LLAEVRTHTRTHKLQRKDRRFFRNLYFFLERIISGSGERIELLSKTVSGIVLVLLLTGMSTIAFNVQPASGTWTGTVYIRADGSIDPPDAPIITYDYVTYTLTDNITSTADGIVVERDNIVIVGEGYTVNGTGEYSYKGMDLSNRVNVTIQNINIQNFYYGIRLYGSFYNSIFGNNIANNGYGICLGYSSNDNSIFGNNIANNSLGIYLTGSSNNVIYHNNFVDNARQVYSWESVNVWDDGAYGNYWSDYEEIYPDAQELDGSGVWDTPYAIDAANRDNYPLVNPWAPPDVAVFDVLPLVTEAYAGQFVNITVIVGNKQTTAETFKVTVYYDNSPIGTQKVVNLGPRENITLVFVWDTIDVTPGNYTIKAEASTLPGEKETEDNTMTSPITIKIKMLGDVNDDKKIDIQDIAMTALAFGSHPEHPRWNSQADINQDGKVDIRDLTLIAINFGKTYP